MNIKLNNLNKDWWHTTYGIDKIWDKYKKYGEGVEIAVVDSGITLNESYFELSSIKGINSDGSGDFSDEKGHGTAIAGIIKANGTNLIGISPGSSLFICKYYKNLAKVDFLINALGKIPESSRVIVISSGFLPQDVNDNQLQTLTNKIGELSKTKLIFCAVGDDYNHTDNPFKRYPASFTDTIAIASVDDKGVVSDFSTKSNQISFAAPGEKFKVLDNNGNITEDSGTSFSTPFAGGVAALLMSIFPDKTNKQILDAIIKSLDKKDDPQLYGKGIINPLKAIDLLTN